MGTSVGTLPTWARPASLATAALIPRDSGARGSIPGFIEVFNDGSIYLLRTGQSSDGTDVHCTSSCGIPDGATISYVGN